MRLLNVHSFTFQEYHEPRKPPKYAIASHRWVADEEATFEDICVIDDTRGKRGSEKSGIRKVKDFAKYVRENLNGVDLVWIDTCCIDKTNNQELSEAINLMFKWYRDAEVCLAYLADIVTHVDEVTFGKSSWFRRGWTLQELLAPSTVIFLTQEWRVIGHKGANGHAGSAIVLDAGPSMNKAIVSVTGIREEVLVDYSTSRGLTVKEKLGWMTGRHTTREEDMWYSLVGILDAPIGTNYGEGESRARKRLLEATQKTPDLKKLAVAAGAAYNSYSEEHVSYCLEGTCTNLLQQIWNWATESNSKRIFWLCGKAGTGKSTISRTIADKLDRHSRLGASFFFKRSEGDRGTARCFFSTIALQMADKVTGIDQFMAAALDADSSLSDRNMQEQFEKLLLQPLLSLSSSPSVGSDLVIVVDALDECKREMDIRMIISLLTQLHTVTARRLRIFLTSRPKLPIQLGFQDVDGRLHQDVTLEELQAATIEHDLRLYFQHRFSDIVKDDRSVTAYEPLPTDWPGYDIVESLVGVAIPLFIFAFTVCQYISQAQPRKRLGLILQQISNRSLSGIDKTYMPILNELISEMDEQEQNHVLEEFRELVGAIVLVAEPLSAQSLSNLLELPLWDIEGRLRSLHSVLDVPKAKDAPIRLFHLSFRDFLVDDERSAARKFRIDERQGHDRLAAQCLRWLSQPGTLKSDLLGVERPGVRKAEMNTEQVEVAISRGLAYACCYWVFHLIESKQQVVDNGEVHSFLTSHLLHWLEALSWLGRLSSAVAYISDIQSAVAVSSQYIATKRTRRKLTAIPQPNQGSRITHFLNDARRFVLQNGFVVALAPLQIYYSALVFSPTESVIRGLFEEKYARALCRLLIVPSLWSAEIQNLEGHDYPVNAVAFSPDGQTMASASDDTTVRLWDARTGEGKQKLGGYYTWVNAVAFSRDGLTLAAAMEDRKVRLWDAKTGKEIQKLEGHKKRVAAVAFSPDGETVASASWDKTVRLWDARTGEERQKLEGHDYSVTAVAFSPDGQTVASASHDKTVRLWDARTGEERQKLEGHDYSVNAVAFSPDGQTVASASHDKTVRLWDARTGEERQKLEGHNSWANAVAFSPDGYTVASASSDKTVRLWDARIGKQRQKLEGHDDRVNAVAFAPDGQTVASASHDKTVRVWDAMVREERQKPEGHDDRVTAVAFSPDGQTVASASDDKTVRLWDARIGKQRQKLEGHDDRFNAVAFAPDGQTVASASYDKTVRVWHAMIREERQKPEGHDDRVTAVAFSPDGQTVALASDDEKVWLWDASTGEERQKLKSSDGTSTLDFAQDGRSWKMNKGRLRLSSYHDPFEDSRPTRHRLGLYGEWIRRAHEDVIWMPYEYRGICSDVYDHLIVIGQASGAVTFVEFQKEEGCNKKDRQIYGVPSLREMFFSESVEQPLKRPRSPGSTSPEERYYSSCYLRARKS